MNRLLNIFDIHTCSNKNRILILDFVRGFLILLVLYHHSNSPYSVYVLQFHMPALFVLSGYTEYILHKNVTLLDYIKSRFFRLIVPYFFFEIVNLILFIINQMVFESSTPSLIDATKCIIMCFNDPYTGLYGRLWFFPAMFVCSIFAYIIKQFFSGNKRHMIAIFIVIMALLSYISSLILSFRLPFTIDIAFLGSAFFLIGHFFGKYIEIYLNTKRKLYDILLLLGFFCLFILANVFGDPACYMFINQYHDFAFMIITALSGTALIFVFAKLIMPILEKIQIVKNIILWYSVNSLAVFPIHLTIKTISLVILKRLHVYNWATLLLCMLILTIPIVNIITSCFPFILGKVEQITPQKDSIAQ